MIAPMAGSFVSFCGRSMIAPTAHYHHYNYRIAKLSGFRKYILRVYHNPFCFVLHGHKMIFAKSAPQYIL